MEGAARTDWAPLGAAAGDTTAARDLAMAATIFHWGLHPWAIYAVVALALAFFATLSADQRAKAVRADSVPADIFTSPGRDEALREPDPVRAAGALNAAIEACVREHPAQYQWAYRRFKTRPAGTPPRYPGRRG